MPTKTTATPNSIRLCFAATVAAVSIMLALPGSALATIHEGHIRFAEPTDPPSIGEAPTPLVEQDEFDQTVSVVYDDEAGTITLTTTVFDPGRWGERHEEESFRAGPSCTPEEEGLYGELSGEWQAKPPSEEVINGIVVSHEPGVTEGTVRLSGIAGTVHGAGSFDGQAFSITFADPHFANLEWRCFTLIDGRENSSFSLGDYPPLETPKMVPSPRVTVRRASRAQTAAMSSAANARHSGGFDASRYRLSRGKVTNNGWGTASWSIFPHAAQPESIVFHVVHGRWRVVTWGSSVCGPGQEAIPATVCRILDL